MSDPDAALARTPEPPYYAVIFTSRRATAEPDEYARMAAFLDELARDQPGFLGIESARGTDAVGITVSYWASEAAIVAWKRVAEHRAAQERGRTTWYLDYALRVAKVERAYTLATSAAVGLG